MLLQPRPLVPFVMGAQRSMYSIELLDSFSSGSLISPRACSERGYLDVVDTNGIMSLGSGVLTINGTPAASDGLVQADSSGSLITSDFVAGRIMRLKLSDHSNVGSGSFLGWGSLPNQLNTDLYVGCVYGTSDQIIAKSIGNSNARSAYTLGSGVHTLIYMLRGNGGGYLIGRNGTDSPVLIWVNYANGATQTISKLALNAIAKNFALDEWVVTDQFAGSFATDDWAAAGLHVASPVSGQLYTAAADGQLHISCHLPPSPTSGQIPLRLLYRYIDANNFWEYRLAWNAVSNGYTAATIRTIGGTSSTRNNTLITDAIDHLVVTTTGQNHERASSFQGTDKVRGSTLNDANDTTGTGVMAIWDAQTTVSDLAYFPHTNDSLFLPLFAAA